jgi:MFS family permease
MLGALVLGRVRGRLSTHRLLAVAAPVFAAALALLALAANLWTALAALVVAGLAWMAMTSTLVSELQLFMPAWVRARGLGIYTVVFCGAQTVGAALWGLVAELFGLTPALLVAAIAVVAGAGAGVFWRLPEIGGSDHEPAVYWAEARLTLDPAPDAGPVLITVEYTIAPDRQAAFLDAVIHLRRSRRRTGASRWELYRDGDHPDRFVEAFQVPSWEEHLRQHDGRLTAADRAIEDAVLSLSDPPARAEHLLPPG